MASQAPDIIVVQKQTALERYTRRSLNVDFMAYLSHDPLDLQGLTAAHGAHTHARDTLENILTKSGLSHIVMNIDELMTGPATIFQPDLPESGLHPASGLVIALGGDGTLLHASHYCGGEVVLLGINSNPAHSIGHLCATDETGIERALGAFLYRKLATGRVPRLHLKPSGATRLPLALNDVLLCNQHPAATSRYQITLETRGEDGTVSVQSEKQQSSGVWVAGPAGSTAAIHSYGLPAQELTTRSILYAVREYYSERGSMAELRAGVLDGAKTEMTLSCRMRQGMVCVDGSDSSLQLGFGESVTISMPETASLELALPPGTIGTAVRKNSGVDP